MQVICCLKGGKSDPDIIRKFGQRARQNDKFHAKVMLCSNRAIVGSANASSNGLPQEEALAKGLIEAGALVDDAGMLRDIRTWFEKLPAQRINDTDLKAAWLARENNMWEGKPAKTVFARCSSRGWQGRVRSAENIFCNIQRAIV